MTILTNAIIKNRLFGIGVSKNNGIIMSKINSPASNKMKP